MFYVKFAKDGYFQSKTEKKEHLHIRTLSVHFVFSN